MTRTRCESLPLPRLSSAMRAGVPYLTDDALYEACGVRVGFFGRRGGVGSGAYDSLNLGMHVGDDRETVDENRRRALAAAGCASMAQRLMAPHQVHGTEIVEVNNPGSLPFEAFAAGADGCVVTCAGVPALMNFADCTPVFLVAPSGVFALAHAGWRGALAGICSIAAGKLAQASGCEPSQIDAYIGPHIQACCYEVSSELLERFVVRYGSGCDAGGRHLSLEAACRADLASCGVDEARIAASSCCTSCQPDEYFSYRASGGTCGRQGMLAYREV